MEWSQFATIAGLMIVLFGWLKLDIRDLRREMRDGFTRAYSRLNDHGERLARIEGHLGVGNREA